MCGCVRLVGLLEPCAHASKHEDKLTFLALVMSEFRDRQMALPPLPGSRSSTRFCSGREGRERASGGGLGGDTPAKMGRNCQIGHTERGREIDMEREIDRQREEERERKRDREKQTQREREGESDGEALCTRTGTETYIEGKLSTTARRGRCGAAATTNQPPKQEAQRKSEDSGRTLETAGHTRRRAMVWGIN